MTDGDDRLFTEGRFRREVREEGCYLIIEVDQASLDQSQRRDRDDRLGHARQPEDGVHGRGRLGLAVSIAHRLTVKGPAVTVDEDDGANETLVGQDAIKQRVDRNRRGIRIGHDQSFLEIGVLVVREVTEGIGDREDLGLGPEGFFLLFRHQPPGDAGNILKRGNSFMGVGRLSMNARHRQVTLDIVGIEVFGIELGLTDCHAAAPSTRRLPADARCHAKRSQSGCKPRLQGIRHAVPVMLQCG